MFPSTKETGTSRGSQEGAETVTLLSTQIPVHTHQLDVSSALRRWMRLPPLTYLETRRWLVSESTPCRIAGRDEPERDQPDRRRSAAPESHALLAVNFIISLQGIFPSRN